MPLSLEDARRALDLAKKAGQESAVTTYLIEAIEALIEHQAELALRQAALVPAGAGFAHGSFGIDVT